MKPSFLSTTILSLLTASALVAQDLPLPKASSPEKSGASLSETSSEPARFDLNFPGGTVKEFVTALDKALGKPVNVVIPAGSEKTEIPSVVVSRVTVPALLDALSHSSRHQVAVPTPGPTGGVNSYQYKEIGFVFETRDRDSADPVWAFIVTNPPDVPSERPAAPAPVVRYFPIAEYLSHFSVEDITAAINSGWNLMGGTDHVPSIRFHEETSLLICAGTKAQLELIPQVLEGLTQVQDHPDTQNFAITAKASRIIVPRIEFRDATVHEAVDYLRKKALELDPEHTGFNIVIKNGSGEDRKVTLSLLNVSTLEALKLTAELADAELEVREHVIVLSSGSGDAPASSVPPVQPVSPQKPPLTN